MVKCAFKSLCVFCARTRSVVLSSRCVCIQSQVVPLLNSESFALENLPECRKCNPACDDCEKNQFVQINLFFSFFFLRVPCTHRRLFQPPNRPTDRRQGFISTLVSEKERRGRGEESERQNENLISPCFFRVDWEQEGFKAAWRPLLQLTVYHCSCSFPCFIPSLCAPVCPCVIPSVCLICHVALTHSCVCKSFHSDFEEGCLGLVFVVLVIVLSIITLYSPS